MGAIWQTILNSFQTTLNPNPEKFYKYRSVTKRSEICLRMRASNAFKFRCGWFGTPGLHNKIPA